MSCLVNCQNNPAGNPGPVLQHAAHSPHSHRPLHAHPHKLIAVTAIFNPHRFKSRYRLYRTFQKQMADAGITLITVEIAMGNRHFEVTDRENNHHIQLFSCEEIWQKERAINIGIARALHLYPKAQYFAWIDADVTFARADIAEETLHKLEHHPVVQMFGQTSFLNPKEESLWIADGFGKKYRQGRHETKGKYPHRHGGHPGLCWAFRREALDAMGGLFDIGIAGSGDLHMCEAWSGHKLFLNHEDKLTREYQRALEIWSHRADRVVQKNIGYVDGLVLHHWHGKSAERGYKTRWQILVDHDFNPFTDILQDTQGLWQFASHKKALAMDLRDSLSLRNEDSVDA